MFPPVYNGAKLYKSIKIFQSYDHKCIVLPPFYGSQCIIIIIIIIICLPRERQSYC